MTKHKPIHLGEPSADDAVTRKFVVNSINTVDAALARLSEETKLYLKHDGRSAMTEALIMGRLAVTNVAEPISA